MKIASKLKGLLLALEYLNKLAEEDRLYAYTITNLVRYIEAQNYAYKHGFCGLYNSALERYYFITRGQRQ